MIDARLSNYRACLADARRWARVALADRAAGRIWRDAAALAHSALREALYHLGLRAAP
jgi:hypothetical protein